MSDTKSCMPGDSSCCGCSGSNPSPPQTSTPQPCQNEACRTAGTCTLDFKTLPNPTTWTNLIEGLRMIFEHTVANVEDVKAYMGAYKSKKSDWKQYENFDDHHYTRNLVDTGNGRYNLILLCWNCSQGSTIHGHADSHCFMKILQGSVQEEQFVMPKEGEEKPMEKNHMNVYKENDVAHIADDLGVCHRVSNPSHVEGAVTLHLYSPPFVDVAIFNEQTSARSTGQMTFHTKYGQPVAQ